MMPNDAPAILMSRDEHIDTLDASSALREWQQLRHLDPETRIERLVERFFLPPINLDVRYQDQMNAVAREMSECAPV